jgi:hypothetical protein
MKIIRYNISKPKKYFGKDGIEKTQWNNIGQITEFYKDDGRIGRIIEIPAIGLEANIFPIVPKDRTPQGFDEGPQSAPDDPGIQSSDIPY